jgi:hypothetical protein
VTIGGELIVSLQSTNRYDTVLEAMSLWANITPTPYQYRPTFRYELIFRYGVLFPMAISGLTEQPAISNYL